MTLSEIKDIANQNNLKPDDYNEIIWQQSLTSNEKIILSLQAFDDQKTSYSLMTLWLEYSVSRTMTSELNKIIYNKYQTDLSNSTYDLEMSMEYSLFFDIFQSPELQQEAWIYFLGNNPTDSFLIIMLKNAAPIPYAIKDRLYQKLISNPDFHIPIYKSIRDSCAYTRGYTVELDKPKALETISRLNIKDHIPDLDKEKGRDTYSQILSFLTTQNGS